MKAIFLVAVLALGVLIQPCCISAETTHSTDAFCYAADVDNINSKATILKDFPKCWVGMHSTKFGVYKTQEGEETVVTIPWKPCQFKKNGFRAEISQPFQAKFHNKKRKYSWGIENEKQYPNIFYQWQFSISDPEQLVKNWASNAFIAQWHTYSHPLDKSVRGGSPVIGLRYSPSDNKNYGFITLTSKIFRSSGFCKDSDTPRKSSYCIKNIARTKIKLEEYNDIKLYVTWDKGFNYPGSVKPLINGQLMQPLNGHDYFKDNKFVFPNKQNAQPNHLKLGWYVISQKKKQSYLKAQKNPEIKLDFCDNGAEIRLKIKNFKYSSF